jgi:hypothetical protein
MFKTLGDTPASVGSGPEQCAVGQILKIVKCLPEVTFYCGFEGIE